MEEKLLTIKQAAEILKCSSASLRNWEKKGNW